MKVKRPAWKLNSTFIKLFCYGGLTGTFMEICMRSFMGVEAYVANIQDRGDPWHWFFYAVLVVLCIGLAVRETRE